MQLLGFLFDRSPPVYPKVHSCPCQNAVEGQHCGCATEVGKHSLRPTGVQSLKGNPDANTELAKVVRSLYNFQLVSE